MSRGPVLFLFSLFLAPVFGAAQAPATTPPQQAANPQPAVIGTAKIAFMDLQQAIFICDEGKKEFSEVQQFVDKMNSELQTKQKELETLKNQLQVQGPKLTDEARSDLEDQISSKETELQRFSEDTQREIDSRRNRTMSGIAKKMMPVIEKLAKEKSLSAVFYLNQSLGWVDPSLLITGEVIAAYNLAHPIATAAAKP